MKNKRTKGSIKRSGTTTGSKISKLFVFVLTCFFISGFTGLSYELIWTRMIVKIIGSSPFAVSIVLTVFMGGLGLGSYLAAGRIDRIRHQHTLLKIYGILELIIGAYALVLPLLLGAFKPLYAIIYNDLSGSFFLFGAVTFVGCFLLLLLPVICMGATLPILSRFYVTSLSHIGSHVGRLYGLNTIGAAVGSLACGFWLISQLGIWGTLGVAIALNMLIGIACLYVASKGRAEQPSKTEPVSTDKKQDSATADSKQRHMGVLALIIFAVSGFCAMGYEVIWIKLLGLIVGPTTYSFTVVLVTFITGLALGSIFFGWLSDRIKGTMQLLLISQIAACAFALLTSQVMGNSQIFFARLIDVYKDSFTQLELMKFIVLFLFMFLPTFFLGATFPLVSRIYTRSLDSTGRSIGIAYAINSAGAVLGSFCAGFLLIPFFGKENGLSIIISLQSIVALLIVLIAMRRQLSRSLQIALLVIGLSLPVLTIYYPHWNRQLLSSGKYHRFMQPEGVNLGWWEALFSGTSTFAQHERGNELLFFGDGIGGFTTVSRITQNFIGDTYLSMLNSGKADASTRGGDMLTQSLLAHFPMMFHPEPKNVLVLGLASGITAGEALYYPIEKLDVLEINRQVVAASDFFLEWNNELLSNERTELIIQDGRAHMELSEQSYDVVISEPSNPWMAGLANLFTQDFYRLTRNRLKKDGIFLQWIHAYQMDWEAFSLVGRTFAHVFPHSVLVRSGATWDRGDYLLIGFKRKAGLNPKIAAANLHFLQQSENITLPSHRALFDLVVNENLAGLFGEGPINTDSRPRLEFAAPRLMHRDDSGISERIRSNIELSEQTESVLEERHESVESTIEHAEFMLSFNQTYPDMVDFSAFDSKQKEKYAEILRNYCAQNFVSNFEFIDDPDIKQQCISEQVQFVLGKLAELPEKSIAYCFLGVAEAQLGDLDRSLFYLAKSIELDPEYADAHANMGITLARRGDMVSAAASFWRAVKLQPDNLAYRQHLNAARSQMNRNQPATGQ